MSSELLQCGDLMHLDLTPTCARPSTSSSTLPRIHFSGTSTSPVPSTVKGSARLSPDGQVRVTYVIAYGGTDRWRLEGIQIGGIGGRRGVLGIWTEADPGQHSRTSISLPRIYLPGGESLT